MNAMLVVLAILFSGIAIIWLCSGDPKRRRTLRTGAKGHDSHLRRIMVGMACVPGIALGGIGEVAAFLIWLGICAVIGWLATLSYSSLDGRV